VSSLVRWYFSLSVQACAAGVLHSFFLVVVDRIMFAGARFPFFLRVIFAYVVLVWIFSCAKIPWCGFLMVHRVSA